MGGETPGAIPPRFSFVVPVFNVEEHVEESLRSLIEQDFLDWEALIVDDHGTDASMDIVARLAAAEPRLRVIDHGENRGLAAARNTGLATARGDYVLFLDSDDTLTSGTLSAVAAHLNDVPAEIAIFDHTRVYPTGRRKRSKNRRRFRKAPATFTAAQFPAVLDALPIAPAKAFSREVLDRANVEFAPGTYEDVPWTLVVLSVATSITWVPHQGYDYRQRAGQSILNTSSQRHFDIHAQYRRLFERLDRPDVDSSLVERIYSNVARHLWLIVSPVTKRLSDADRPAFIRASRGTLWAIRPSFASWLRGWKGPRHAALATGSPAVYSAVRGSIKRRRKRLKARALRKARRLEP